MAPETQEAEAMEQVSALDEIFGGEEPQPDEQGGTETPSEPESAPSAEPEATGEPEALPAVDWDAVDVGTVPHGVASQTPAYQGLLGAMQREREISRELREQNQQLTEALAGRQGEPPEQLDEDEPVTRREAMNIAKGILEADQARVREQGQADAKTQRGQHLAQCVAAAKAKYANAPKGLDFETVFREGAAWLEQNDPWLAKAIINDAPDPAQATYSLALSRVPSLRKRVEAARNQRVVNQLAVNAGSPPKSGATAAATEGDGDLRALRLILNDPSHDEFLDYLGNDEPEE